MTTPGSETVLPPQTQTADVTSPIVTDIQVTVASPVVQPVEPTELTITAPVEPAIDSTANEPSSSPTSKKMLDRINELTAKRYDAERRAKMAEEARTAAEEIIARLTTNAQPNTENTPTAKPELTEQEIERRAHQKAAQMAYTAKFNETCDQIADAGKKEFRDWQQALDNLTLVGALGRDVSPEFLETAIELKQPQKLLHYLGTNLEEAERITKLPPKKMAMEMARLEAQLNAPTIQCWL